MLCVPCGIAVRNKGSIKLHVSCRHESRGCKCRLCGKLTTTRTKLKGHVISVHEASYQCVSCDLVVNSEVKPKTHKKRDLGFS